MQEILYFCANVQTRKTKRIFTHYCVIWYLLEDFLTSEIGFPETSLSRVAFGEKFFLEFLLKHCASLPWPSYLYHPLSSVVFCVHLFRVEGPSTNRSCKWVSDWVCESVCLSPKKFGNSSKHVGIRDKG